MDALRAELERKRKAVHEDFAGRKCVLLAPCLRLPARYPNRPS